MIWILFVFRTIITFEHSLHYDQKKINILPWSAATASHTALCSGGETHFFKISGQEFTPSYSHGIHYKKVICMKLFVFSTC
jgi:hypothetical protein